jgi:alkaline phosphatase
MTEAALRILDNDPDGFFLMVEGGRIDHCCHSSGVECVVHETAAFDEAVQTAIDWARGATDTLILVTADHETGGLRVLQNNGIGRYPTVVWETGSDVPRPHTSANVPVYAWGPNSGLVSGTIDNTDVYRVMTAGVIRDERSDVDENDMVDARDLMILLGDWHKATSP